MAQNTKRHVEYYNEHYFYILVSFLITTSIEAREQVKKQETSLQLQVEK